jgi:ABC-type Fe3+ transport system substrate-binding protein
LAKEEKALVLWAAGPTAGYESAARAFEQKFLGITVSLTGGFSKVLNARIEEQVRAQKVETDLAILQTIQDFIAWNRRGLLLHFKPDGFDKRGEHYGAHLSQSEAEPADRVSFHSSSPSTTKWVRVGSPHR